MAEVSLVTGTCHRTSLEPNRSSTTSTSSLGILAAPCGTVALNGTQVSLVSTLPCATCLRRHLQCTMCCVTNSLFPFVLSPTLQHAPPNTPSARRNFPLFRCCETPRQCSFSHGSDSATKHRSKHGGCFPALGTSTHRAKRERPSIFKAPGHTVPQHTNGIPLCPVL